MELKALMAVVMAWISVPIIITAIVAFYHRNRSSESQRTIRQLVVVALITQLISYWLWRKALNNLPILHLYTPLEFVLIIRFYKVWSGDFIVQKRLNWLAYSFVLVAIINVIFFQSLFEINSYIRGLESVIIIILSLSFWAKIMRELQIERLVQSPLFWFNTAFLIYFSVNFILFVFSSDLNKLAVEKAIQPWLVHCFFMTIYYLLLAIGLWRKQHQ
ncbi:MAG: hypothetical protein MI810_17400 [Flavobacteriales bacterium]|nr:hypothetical protein [Flavobacteriales bacterium]